MAFLFLVSFTAINVIESCCHESGSWVGSSEGTQGCTDILYICKGVDVLWNRLFQLESSVVKRRHWRKCLHCCHNQNNALRQHYTYGRFGSTLQGNANSNKNRISLPPRSKPSREHLQTNHTTWSGFSCKSSKKQRQQDHSRNTKTYNQAKNETLNQSELILWPAKYTSYPSQLLFIIWVLHILVYTVIFKETSLNITQKYSSL